MIKNIVNIWQKQKVPMLGFLKKWWWALLLLVALIAGSLFYLLYTPNRYFLIRAECKRVLYGVTQIYHCQHSKRFSEKDRFDFCRLTDGQSIFTRGYKVLRCGRNLPEGGDGVLSPTAFVGLNCDWSYREKGKVYTCVKKKPAKKVNKNTKK